jgi:hypothetical protein
MELSELDPEQSGLRASIVEALVAAGWEPTVIHEMAEEGQDVNYLASLEYGEGDLDLTVDYEPDAGRLHVTLGSAWGDNTELSMPADGRTGSGLAVLVKHQDTLSDETLADCVAELRGVYPELTVEADDGDE